MIHQKLWRKKKFQHAQRKRDHILNVIVHSGLIGITANKTYFCFQMPQASTLSCLHWDNGSKTKILIFQLITLVKQFFTPVYISEFEACAKQIWMPPWLRAHMLRTACLQTVLRVVTLIKARWLNHRNTFGLGSSLSFNQTLKFPRRFESCLALMV